MPLYILAPMVAVGLALVIGAAWMTDRNRYRKPLDGVGFRKRFSRDFPNEKILQAIVTEGNTAAILQLAGHSRIGLVFQMGQNQATRLLDRSMIQRVSRTETGFDLELYDFSAHSVHLEFDDAAKRTTALRWFEELESA